MIAEFKDMSQGNLKEALKIGLEVLKLWGNLNRNSKSVRCSKRIGETAALLAGREIET